MIKYGFRIKTRGGLVVDNLVIQARDQAEAERRLQQMYLHCEIIECSVLPMAAREDEMDFERIVSLIAKQDPEEP